MVLSIKLLSNSFPQLFLRTAWNSIEFYWITSKSLSHHRKTFSPFFWTKRSPSSKSRFFIILFKLKEGDSQWVKQIVYQKMLLNSMNFFVRFSLFKWSVKFPNKYCQYILWIFFLGNRQLLSLWLYMILIFWWLYSIWWNIAG